MESFFSFSRVLRIVAKDTPNTILTNSGKYSNSHLSHDKKETEKEKRIQVNNKFSSQEVE